MTTLCCTGTSSAADSPQELQALRDELTQLRADYNIGVLAVSIARDIGGVHTIVIGGTPDTPLRWGSITKTFTALAVLGLHESGHVILDAPLHRYVDPGLWQNPWRKTDPVRVIHLLELRAGFTDLSALEFSYNEPISLAGALQLNPGHRTTRWPPGLQHAYSNMTVGLTQALIEAVSHMSYAQAVEKYVFEPLGMEDAGFSPRKDLPGGFRADGTTPIPYWHMTFDAYGALNAPLADINRLLLALLAQDTLSPLVRKHMFQPHGRAIGADFEFDYASGFYPRVRNGFVWQVHGGDADGYRSRIAVMRAHQRGYVANINTDNPPVLRQIERLLDAYLVAGLTPSIAPVADVSSADLQRLTGNYYPASVRFGFDAWRAGKQASASVTVQDGHLVFTRASRRTRLIPLSKDRFRRAQDPVATIAFIRDGNQTYLHGELGNYVRTEDCPKYLVSLPQCDG